MPNLAEKLGFGGKLYIKRDDLTGLAAGGNKSRKLEYLMAEALKRDADTIITAGGLQSNHCIQTVVAAKKLNLDCHIVLSGDEPKHPNGNLFLDILAGATVHYVKHPDRDLRMHELAEEMRKAGKNPYVIPVGGSNALGTVGYVMAMPEVVRQMELMNIKCDRIIVASSSGGTMAGMVLGAKLVGFKVKITGISIDRVKTGKGAFPPELAELANKTAELLELDIRLTEKDFELEYDYLGAGYAIVGDNERHAIKTLAQSEGIFIGPVYTGRAMGAMIDKIRNEQWKNETILFWHTGDSAALFDYVEELNK
ncbi:MAG: D-cysteine desulfhydrase family protein [Candidatus Marinimicrobia bacterium]|nr:D-cysteine desulfhydrase family protein [Candidatus Neomarinimicrobiota bacterium]